MPLFMQEGQWELQEGPHFWASHPFMQKYNDMFVVSSFNNQSSSKISDRVIHMLPPQNAGQPA